MVIKILILERTFQHRLLCLVIKTKQTIFVLGWSGLFSCMSYAWCDRNLSTNVQTIFSCFHCVFNATYVYQTSYKPLLVECVGWIIDESPVWNAHRLIHWCTYNCIQVKKIITNVYIFRIQKKYSYISIHINKCHKIKDTCVHSPSGYCWNSSVT